MLFLVSKTCKVSAGIPQDQRGNRARFKRSACKVLAAPSRQMCKVRTADRQGLDGRRARFGRSTFGKCARLNATGPKKQGHHAKRRGTRIFPLNRTYLRRGFPPRRTQVVTPLSAPMPLSQGTGQSHRGKAYANPNKASRRSQKLCSGSSTVGSSCVGASMGSVDMTNCTSETLAFFALA